MKTSLVKYYAQRAQEYERVYDKPERQANIRQLHALFEPFNGLDVLELSCGTGYWTRSIAKVARSVTACDINDEVLNIARSKTWTPSNVEFVKADSYLLPDFGRKFSGGFAGFWWSHIPRDRVRSFLEGFHAQLSSGAFVMYIDNRYVEGSSTPISRTDAHGNSYQQRPLRDGSVHEVLKNFPSREELVRSVNGMGCAADVLLLEYYWVLTYRVP